MYQQVTVFNRTVINCTVMGNPRPTIKWFKNNKIIRDGRSDINTKMCAITALAEECTSTDTLIIDRTLPHHAGRYVCKGKYVCKGVSTSLMKVGKKVSTLGVQSTYVCL